MAFLFPRVAVNPVRCVPLRHEVAPLWSLFDDTIAQLDRASRHSAHSARQQARRRPFNPRFDVKESDNSYVVEGELPGFDPKNLSIEFVDDGHTLQIKGRTVSSSGSHAGDEQASSTHQAVEDSEEQTTTKNSSTTETEEAVTSESSSVKSHQATVEDEDVQPTNDTTNNNAGGSSTVASQPQPQATLTTTPRAPETKHWISERYTGEFSRSFSFPSRIDQDAVKASLKDGILSVTLPFAPKLETRRIAIE